MTRQSVQRWERPLLYLLILALTLLLGIMQWHLYRARTAPSVELGSLVIGMSLKEFAATPFDTVTGNTIALETFFDQPGLLIFLHSECPYCRLDVPLWHLLAQATQTLGRGGSSG